MCQCGWAEGAWWELLAEREVKSLRFLMLDVRVSFVGLSRNSVSVIIGGGSVVGLDKYLVSGALPPIRLRMVGVLCAVGENWSFHS